jgi:hypothetical protein
MCVCVTYLDCKLLWYRKIWYTKNTWYLTVSIFRHAQYWVAGSFQMVKILPKGRCPGVSFATPATFFLKYTRSHMPQSQTQIFTDPKKKGPRPDSVGGSGVKSSDRPYPLHPKQQCRRVHVTGELIVPRASLQVVDNDLPVALSPY